jgi:abortive infection bacteriophage resistance protein
LRAIGYYRLGAYWLPFEQAALPGQTRSKKFAAGVSIDDIMSIYIFDRHLRAILMEAIERIEIAIRSRWTNRLALAHGAHAHLDPGLALCTAL